MPVRGTYASRHCWEDRLDKIRPLLTKPQQRFEAVYSLGREVAVDDSLLLCKGRLGFRCMHATEKRQVLDQSLLGL